MRHIDARQNVAPHSMKIVSVMNYGNETIQFILASAAVPNEAEEVVEVTGSDF